MARPDDPIHVRVETERRAFFQRRRRRATPSGPPIRQAMVSPLIGESGLIGSMTVANRLTEGTSFDDDDLRLLETLANQAAVALENGQLEQSLAELSRLKEQLRYQAYHDPLTGLAEPGAVRRAGRARSSPTAGEAACSVVLFLDLDDFKVVNDTLGHAAGDRLLAAVAERIRSCIRADDLAARLGGDEFARPADRRGRARAARSPSRTGSSRRSRCPFPIAGPGARRSAAASASPSARDTSEHADELLRNADVAMYTAKAGGKRRVAVFDPTMHAAIVARHALSRRAAAEHRPGRAGSSTTSRSSSSPPAGSPASRRSSAGATRPAASIGPDDFIAPRRGERA